MRKKGYIEIRVWINAETGVSAIEDLAEAIKDKIHDEFDDSVASMIQDVTYEIVKEAKS